MYRFECSDIALTWFNRIFLVALLRIDCRRIKRKIAKKTMTIIYMRNDGGQTTLVLVELLRSG